MSGRHIKAKLDLIRVPGFFDRFYKDVHVLLYAHGCAAEAAVQADNRGHWAILLDHYLKKLIVNVMPNFHRLGEALCADREDAEFLDLNRTEVGLQSTG